MEARGRRVEISRKDDIRRHRRRRRRRLREMKHKTVNTGWQEILYRSNRSIS